MYSRFLRLFQRSHPTQIIGDSLKDNLRIQAAAIEKAEMRRTIEHLSDALMETRRREDQYRAEYVERSCELIEARQMAGAGPWLVAESRSSAATGARLRESDPIVTQGAYGDIDLALQNVEWRREVNLSWLEFSRWGIQQIMLISRLYYIKNPLIQRGINVAAHYVFGRGVEVSSPDETANDVLKEFFERNKSVLGQIGLTDLERRKYYDGNLFFALFSDADSTGTVSIRTIDATEVMDIVCDPDDTDKPQYYRRCWTERRLNEASGSMETVSAECWYPALGYDPPNRPAMIGKIPIRWESPVLHRKCGAISKWHFGCPLVYAALDWAKNARKFLEACLTVALTHAQIGHTLTTKGGQQAIEGAKSQLSTTVGPATALWDTNPTAVNGSIFASGPGTVLEAFSVRGKGNDPKEVGKYVDMVACVLNIPPTFFGDLETANLATATSLDRPTELNFLEKQEAWREDLLTIAKYVLMVSKGAPSGRLKEALAKLPVNSVEIREGSRVHRRGRWVMEAKKSDTAIEVSVNFPAIVDADIPNLVKAAVEAGTLNNRGGQWVGTDERATVRLLYDLLDIDNADELIEEQYPDYEPARSKQLLTAPIKGSPPYDPGGKPQLRAGQPDTTPREAQKLARLLIEAIEAERNGAGHHSTR